MAIVVSNGVADELRRSATESAANSVEAIVRGYVDPALGQTSLDLGARLDPAIDAQLERLTLSGEIRRINIWSRDGRIVYSSQAELRGQRFSIGPTLASAYAGETVSRYAGGDDARDAATVGDLPADGLPPMSGRFLELFVPIRGAVDGNPIGVYDVYEDARLIEQRIDDTRSGVFVVALVASSLLVALIWLALGGASRVLAGQNRRLQEQATTERLLLVDMQRKEERFRSLVQNAADGVVVLGEDGVIRYESPAVERILGRHAGERVGQLVGTDIHPDDRAAVERGLADVAAVSGAEGKAEFRARHADDSWRTLEAIAKNLIDDPAVGGVVVNYRDITERKTLEEQLRHQAFHDVLTGLENRFLFLDRLGHALARAGRGGRPTAVLFLDLDDFKAVNDRLGHAEGDKLLVDVAQRLKVVTRTGDTVARLGGDEFAIIVEETDPAEAEQTAARILATLTPPFQLGDRPIVVRVSIGIAVQSVDGSEADADELLRRADIAMYAAKAAGGHRHVTYEPQLYDATMTRMELKADLRGALDRGELHVEYQPIVDLDSAQIVGSEALMRWTHPVHGPVPPVDFIPLAEESGLISELGRWILTTACQQTKAWQETTGSAGLTISVNLSGHQILDRDLVTDVRRILAETGLAPNDLTLEMTESVLVQDVEATVGTLRVLKSLGVRLAIDDFGTGYSSLSYLRQFPIDILKIDRSFVASLDGSQDSTALIRSILDLSSTLRLETVAEGIEETEQHEVLRSLGARQGQGYLFARPMAPEDLGDLLAGRTTNAHERNEAPKPSTTTRRRKVPSNRLNPEAEVIHASPRPPPTR